MHKAGFRFSVLLVFALLAAFGVQASPDGKDKGSKKTGGATASAASPSIFIMGRGEKAVDEMARFMLSYNNTLDTHYLVRLLATYIVECRREGINHDIAVVQMAHETGFLRFNGSVSRFQNNFCGLGAVNATAAGDWFGSMEEGIRAHIQHLKAYSSTDSLNAPVVDKRFRHVLQRGTVFTIFDLTGRWATDPDYAEKLHRLLIALKEM